MYILDVFGHFIGAETRCNWYLCDINIFLLSKKGKHEHDRNAHANKELKNTSNFLKLVVQLIKNT
jgi:hypothetical protein